MLLATLNFHRMGCLINMQLIFLILLEMRIISGDVSSHYWETPYSQPYFDNSSRREVTSIVGQAALLQCRVRNLGDRAVSWIRKRDLHILTVGILTYTNDQRFQSLHTEGSDEWTLRISSPQPRDSGTYECQVSTEPKISQGFRLNVVVSRAKILGNPELFIKSGSDINLTCLAMQSPIPPSFIYWYKGKRLMNYSQRGGISVITERTTRTSKLLISKATPADSGNYTCSPSSSDSASVVVHVINGEHPAAMQHGNNSATTLIPSYRRRRHMLSSSLSFTSSGEMTSIYANISKLYSILLSIIDFMIATNCCLVLFGICLSQRLLQHTSGSPNNWLNR
ncbi:kin of IRRE-like protein 1 isoform X2 [Musca autumnalis]|uniref:kin of IRRE-like protein 1 isoform X2 n=1 Tax=Musca autumnalis TaxID=221902 RepID=UPI003CF97D6D